MRLLIPFFIVILLYGGQARADCKADCQSEYQSEINSCKALFSDPDDADDLKTCMDDAKKEYDSCLEECETEASSSGVRIRGIEDPYVLKSKGR